MHELPTVEVGLCVSLSVCHMIERAVTNISSRCGCGRAEASYKGEFPIRIKVYQRETFDAPLTQPASTLGIEPASSSSKSKRQAALTSPGHPTMEFPKVYGKHGTRSSTRSLPVGDRGKLKQLMVEKTATIKDIK